MKEPGLIMTIDIGNTAMKVSVFDGNNLVQSVAGPPDSVDAVEALLTFYSIDAIVYCCVGQDNGKIAERLQKGDISFFKLEHDTKLPIEICYKSRPTLGLDRVAAAVGVSTLQEPVLVVDAGTAVTCDMVADNKFLGGNISPGLRLRFRSLNSFTSRLPLVSPNGDIPEFGYDTDTAIRAGVMNGLVAELEMAWKMSQKKYPRLKMILSGGDASLLAPILKARGVSLEIDTAIVGKGLVGIYNYCQSQSPRKY